MPGFLRPTVALAFAQLVQMAASLATLEILSGALGPAGMGQLGSVVATYVLLGSLTDLGTGVVAIREMVREPERAREVAVVASRLRVALGGAAALLGLLRYALVPVEESGAGLVGALFPVVQGLGSARLYLQAVGDHGGHVRANVVGRLAQVGLVALAVWLDSGVRGAVAALVGGELAIATLLRIEAGSLPVVELRTTFERARELAAAAAPLALGFVLAQAVESVDVLLLRSLRTLDETGLYSLAERPLAILDQVPRLLLWSAFTALARSAAAGDAAGLARSYRRTLAALGVAAAPVAAGAWLAGPSLLRLLFDARFDGAGAPFVVLALGSAVSFVSAPASSLLVALGRTRAVLAASALAFAVDLGLDLVLIPGYGPVGAAWAWTAARAAEALLLHACVLGASGIAPPLGSFARSAFAALVLVLALVRHTREWPALALVGAGIVVYAIAAVATGAIGWESREEP
jgi:O-antigen/teichoic acid export membrane protein